MPDFKTSCTLIMTQISVSFTGDFRLDLMLVSAIVWVMIRTKRQHVRANFLKGSTLMHFKRFLNNRLLDQIREDNGQIAWRPL